MNNTNIKNCNNELLELQKQHLIDEIINGNNKKYFKIFDIEAGCRKTRTAEQALAKLALTTNKNAILVRRNNKDCRESAMNINRISGAQVAFVYNNEDILENERMKVKKSLHTHRVVVITSQKYLVLANDKSQRKIFAEGRDILIIDEFIDDIKPLKLDYMMLNLYKSIIGSDLIILNKFNEFISKLEDYAIANNKGRFFVRITPYINFSKKISELKRLIKDNLTNDWLKQKINEISNSLQVDFSLLDYVLTVSKLCNKIDEIAEFYKKVCIIENGVFYTTDSRCQKWLLNNNIILDASGNLQIAYLLNSDLYHLEGCDKVLDHSNWNIVNVVANTTTSGKTRIANYYDIINQILKKYGSKTLVIGNKAELNMIDCPSYSKCYFGNITGSNSWADYKNVIVIHTPNVSDTNYILKALHYARNDIEIQKCSWAAKSTGRNMTQTWKFENPYFEKIRTFFIAEEVYQALKRVNRTMEHNTNAVLIMNNFQAVEMLKLMLKNCGFEVSYNTDFKYKWTRQEDYIVDLKSNSYAQKFMTLLAELVNGQHKELQHKDKIGNIVIGTYKKKDLREYLGIINCTIFSNKVLNKTDVIQYCQTRNIDTSGQYVKINNIVV